MLKRLYVHNYKCLVNFEINFDQDISLFLGANGSGKSTVFEVLAKLRRVIIDEEKIENVFLSNDFPRWSLQDNERGDTRFELDIVFDNFIYRYLLIVDFEIIGINDIKEEYLYCDNKTLVESKNNKTTFLSTFGEKITISFDGFRSGIKRLFPFYHPIFLNSLSILFIARINPYTIGSVLNKSNSEVKKDFSNFPEWFAHLNEKNRRGVSIFENVMRDILSGFDYFRIEQAGQAKVLQVDFKNQANKKEVISYYFDELSEGQKVLIALYALIYCTPDNSIICIDEPENFLALPEIQPWFDALYDQCAERNLQALLISHHPKIINLLASDSGYWFSRENNLTRIQKISPEDESGLSIAELIERGWIYEH